MTNDASTLTAIASGDSRAFARWLADAEPRVRASLLSFAGVVDVEAVLQETLLRVWQVAPKVTLHPEGDTLVRLAVRIGRNLAIDHARSLQAQRNRELRDAESLESMTATATQSGGGFSDPLLRKTIAACRERLPKKPRQVLDARLGHPGGVPDQTLALGLRMKTNTFLQNLSRARKFLLECLRKAGVEVPA